MTANHFGFRFDDSDVVNPGEFIPKGAYNPHNVRPWLLHEHGFTVALVFASSLQDALDEAVDNDKLEKFAIRYDDATHRSDYGNGKEGGEFDWREGVTFLGNASEPFDIESLEAVELPNPPFSFAAMFDAAK